MRVKRDAYQPYRSFQISAEASTPQLSGVTLDLRSLRRHAGKILACIVLFLALGLLFVLLRSTWYMASTRLVIDHRNPSLTVNNSVFMTSDLSGRLVDSQVEILRSQKVMANALELLEPEKREALVPGHSILSAVLGGIGIKQVSAVTNEQRENLALAQLRKLVTVNRIGETFTIEIVARARDPYLAMRLATVMADSFLDDQAKASANAAKGASPWLLERLKNSGTTARIIADATMPLAPDGPRSRYVIIAFLIAGMVVGVGVAFTYDILDTKIRTPDQAAQVAQAECVGLMPVIKEEACGAPPDWKGAERAWTRNYPNPTDLRVLNQCCIAATVERSNLQTIGVTSCLQGEGKSTIAVNLARTISESGLKVLLVDAAKDTRRLSGHLAPHARVGIESVLAGKNSLDRVVVKDPETRVRFLPYGRVEAEQNPYSIWKTGGQDLAALKEKYDVIVIDLPSIVSKSSVRGIAPFLDGILLVVEYAKLPIEAAAKILGQSGATQEKIFGVVLNKVDESDYDNYATLPREFRSSSNPVVN